MNPMTIDILAFGIAKDILGGTITQMEFSPGMKVSHLKKQLTDQYPDFQKLASLRIAVNSEYQEDDFVLNAKDEIAIIPPVAGG